LGKVEPFIKKKKTGFWEHFYHGPQKGPSFKLDLAERPPLHGDKTHKFESSSKTFFCCFHPKGSLVKIRANSVQPYFFQECIRAFIDSLKKRWLRGIPSNF
jgi:hypothetical protein